MLTSTWYKVGEGEPGGGGEWSSGRDQTVEVVKHLVCLWIFGNKDLGKITESEGSKG